MVTLPVLCATVLADHIAPTQKKNPITAGLQVAVTESAKFTQTLPKPMRNRVHLGFHPVTGDLIFLSGGPMLLPKKNYCKCFLLCYPVSALPIH